MNSALDLVEEQIVNRLENTGLVTFDDEENTISGGGGGGKMTERGKDVVRKLKQIRTRKAREKSASEKKREAKEEEKAKKKKEDKEADLKLMEIVKRAQKPPAQTTDGDGASTDVKETNKEKDALVKALLKEVQRLRERVKTSYEDDEKEGENASSTSSTGEGEEEEEEDSILISAIEEIEATFALRSELDVSLRQLEKSKQSTVDSELLEKEREGFEERLTREVEKKTKTLEVRKTAAENAADQARKKFAEAEQNLRELRKRHDEAQSRIFYLENNEMEMKSTLAKDRESLKLEVEKLQKREEEFVNKTNNGGVMMRNNSNSLPELGIAALEEKLQVKERMIAKLAEDVEEMEKASVEKAKEAEKNVASLTKQLTETKLKLEETKRELMKEQSNAEMSGAKVVEELKERVRVLQALVDSEDGDVAEAMAIRGSDDTNEKGEGEEEEGNGGKALIAVRDKNRRLAAEIAVAKRAKDDANKEKEVAIERAVAAETKLMQAAETISVLEDDLAKRTTSTPSAATDDASSSSATTTGTTSNSDADMIAILASQRDRFKRRVSELDEEKARVTTELSSTSAKVAKLEEDNVKLFEKIRYVQKYYASKLSGGASAAVKILRVDESGVPLSDSLESEKSANKSARYSCGVGGVTIGVDRLAISDGMRKRAQRYGCGFGGGHGDLESASLGGDEGGVVGRYRERYLARLNPFNAFKRTESEDGGASNLATHDRLAMAGGKALLSSRGFRSFFALYFLAMHLFLAMVLYSHRAKFSLD